MINTQPMLSQFHLANASTGTNNAHHHYYLSNKKQHVHHKHSQSLDANGPSYIGQCNADYIAISECHSGKSFIQQQQQKEQTKSLNSATHSCSIQDRLASHATSSIVPASLPKSTCLLGSSTTARQPLSKSNCESKIVLHARSSSNIVLGSKKQYAPQMSHLSSAVCSPANQKFCLLSDKSTNRHFKVYEKNELANSTSLIDVSLANCLGTSNCNCSCNKNFNMNNLNSLNSSYATTSAYSTTAHPANQTPFLKCNQATYLPRSMNKFYDTSSLNDKFDNLSLNNNFLNCNQLSSLNQNKSSASGSHQLTYFPPRPPKPINLRISNQITEPLSTTANSLNNNSFNESFSTSFIVPSDEEYSPTSSSKLYGSYYQFQANQPQQQRPPKNSLSSSCSSNVSPFCNSNAQDSVFVYDQNQLNMSNFQTFHHSSSRLNSFEDTDCSDKSPTYLNNFSLNSLNSQASPKATTYNNNLPSPPAINRDLKPRKVGGGSANESRLNKMNSQSTR